jgi:hypothetical protein
MEFFKHIGLVLKGINPNKLAEVIYKAYIIFFLPTDSGAAPRHLRTLALKELWTHSRKWGREADESSLACRQHTLLWQMIHLTQEDYYDLIHDERSTTKDDLDDCAT